MSGGVVSHGRSLILGLSYTTCSAVSSPTPHFLLMVSTARTISCSQYLSSRWWPLLSQYLSSRWWPLLRQYLSSWWWPLLRQYLSSWWWPLHSQYLSSWWWPLLSQYLSSWWWPLLRRPIVVCSFLDNLDFFQRSCFFPFMIYTQRIPSCEVSPLSGSTPDGGLRRVVIVSDVFLIGCSSFSGLFVCHLIPHYSTVALTPGEGYLMPFIMEGSKKA